MARFDAELYLRLAGEQAILGIGRQQRRPWESPLDELASALVAVGAISVARARAVIYDYALAQALRSEQGRHLGQRIAMRGTSRSRPAKGRALTPRRVVPCDETIEDAKGTLHVRHVTLSEDSTSIAISWRPASSGQSRSRRNRQMAVAHGHVRPPAPALTDDRGTTAGSSFSGGGSDEHWEGRLTADRPLARDTRWIEIDGHRIELTGEPVQCTVTIEHVGEQPAASRYLWSRLAVGDLHGAPEIEGSIEALIAAGALTPDDPLCSEVRAVREAMPAHRGMPGGGARGVRRLPEPWRSLLSRVGAQDGPQGTVALSAVTPEFDGFSVAVTCLESQPDGFTIEVDVAPGLDGHGPFRSGLETSQLAWWAGDDRGNHHLGQIGSWSTGSGASSGEIGFWPALHPAARRLHIMPTAATTRAVIGFAPPWTGGGSAAAGTAP